MLTYTRFQLLVKVCWIGSRAKWRLLNKCPRSTPLCLSTLFACFSSFPVSCLPVYLPVHFMRVPRRHAVFAPYMPSLAKLVLFSRYICLDMFWDVPVAVEWTYRISAVTYSQHTREENPSTKKCKPHAFMANGFKEHAVQLKKKNDAKYHVRSGHSSRGRERGEKGNAWRA